MRKLAHIRMSELANGLVRGGICALIVLFAQVANAQPEAIKVAADSAYIAGRYEDAIKGYEEILAQGHISPEVHFNLGNALFKTKRIAPSILHYERALKLAPQDEDIRFNLKLAGMTTKDKIEQMPELFFVRWWNTMLQAMPMDKWAWSCVVAFLLVLIGIGIFRFSTHEGMRRTLFYTSFVIGLWGIFSGYAAQKQYVRLMNDDRAVVFRPTLNVKSAPEQSGKDLFVVHEGLVVQITEEIGGYYRIRLSDGNVGWVPKDAVEGI